MESLLSNRVLVVDRVKTPVRDDGTRRERDSTTVGEADPFVRECDEWTRSSTAESADRDEPHRDGGDKQDILEEEGLLMSDHKGDMADTGSIDSSSSKAFDWVRMDRL